MTLVTEDIAELFHQRIDGLYEESEVTATLNFGLKANGSPIRLSQTRQTDYAILRARGTRGGQYFIPMIGWEGWEHPMMRFRSILKRNPRAARPRIQVNGQAGKGTREVAFWGEVGLALRPARAHAVHYLDVRFGGVEGARQLPIVGDPAVGLKTLGEEAAVALSPDGPWVPLSQLD